jgi:ribokinase
MPNKKYDVITFGSAVVDVFIDSKEDEKKGEFCFPAGCKIAVDNINFTVGGGGTNTAAAFSKLGLKAGFAGKIGDGHNAGIVLRELKKSKVDFLGKQGREHTGFSIIFGGRGGDRVILTHKGINNLLRIEDLNFRKLDADWFYIASLMGESFKTIKKIIPIAKKKGIKIAFNPSQYQVKQGAKKLKVILENTDVLILNKEEAITLVGKGDLLGKLNSLGPKIVCVTDGKNGNEVYDGIHRLKAKVHQDIKVVERTGAGDAFGAGFIAGLIKNMAVEEAMQCGIANSESVIQTPGAKGGLLGFRDLMKIVKRRPCRIIRKKSQK